MLACHVKLKVFLIWTNVCFVLLLAIAYPNGQVWENLFNWHSFLPIGKVCFSGIFSKWSISAFHHSCCFQFYQNNGLEAVQDLPVTLGPMTPLCSTVRLSELLSDSVPFSIMVSKLYCIDHIMPYNPIGLKRYELRSQNCFCCPKMGEQMSKGTEGLEAYWIMLPRNLVYCEILSLSLFFSNTFSPPVNKINPHYKFWWI